MYFNSNLSFLRKDKGLTQEEVAESLGLACRAVSFYESGEQEPTLENLLNLARFFEVSVDDLLSKDMRPAGFALSGNLKYLRRIMEYTQTDMCRLLKISQPALANYENGTRVPTIEALVNISEFFGVTVDDLLKKDLSKEEQM